MSDTLQGVDLVRRLGRAPDRDAVMAEVTAAAVGVVPGADDAGLTIMGANRFATLAPTSELPPVVDALQYEHGGPCVDAVLDDSGVVHVDDLRSEQRWPAFAAAATAGTPTLSMLSCQLYVDETAPIGSLNLYARKPHAFDQDAVRAGELVAATAALALAHAAERERADNLARALESSRQIGAATGVLMSRRLLTRQEAFNLLRIASQRSNRKLREVADDVLEAGDLLDPPR